MSSALPPTYTLLPVAQRTAAFTGPEIEFERGQHILFCVNLQANATPAGSTMDVFVDTTVDGINWIPIVHADRIINGLGAIQMYYSVFSGADQVPFENVDALGTHAFRNAAGRRFRARGTITGSPDATFGVTACVW
jgi:hypothetical protein